MDLIANPSKTGWTTQDLIDHELPVFDASDPSFATVLIGVNDWVQEVSKEKFHSNLKFILDHVQKRTGDKTVLITIPDFSITPEGPEYSKGRDIQKGLQEFNAIIKAEAKDRSLQCVDIFPVSLEMKGKPDLTGSDGLHPSAKEYALWEKLIFPAALKILKR